jgi:hypothetical protein
MASGTTRISVDGQTVSTAANAQVNAGDGINVISAEGYLDGAFITGAGSDDYLYVNLNNEGALGSSDGVSFRDSTIDGGNGEDEIFVYNFPSANSNVIENTIIRGGNADDFILVSGDLDIDNAAFDGLIVLGAGAEIQGDGGLGVSSNPLAGNDYIALDEIIADGGKVKGQAGNDFVYVNQSVFTNNAVINGNDGFDRIRFEDSEIKDGSRIIGGSQDDSISVDEAYLHDGVWVNGSKGTDYISFFYSVLDGSENQVQVRGNDGNDYIDFRESSATGIKVNGNLGDDGIFAGDNDQRIQSGTYQSFFYAQTGINDSEIFGGAGDDYIVFFYNTGAGNLLSGDDGNDVLIASKGSPLTPDDGIGDRLDGGTDADWAFTGVGDDTYVFNSGDGIAADQNYTSEDEGTGSLFFYQQFGAVIEPDAEFNALGWEEGVDLLITQENDAGFPEDIAGFFDLLDDSVEFNGGTFTAQNIVFNGGTPLIGIATINAQGDFVSLIDGDTSGYVVLGNFWNNAGFPQPDFSPTTESYFATQYIDTGIGSVGDLEDYIGIGNPGDFEDPDFFFEGSFDGQIEVNAFLFFDSGERLGVGNSTKYEDVDDVFILTTRDVIDAIDETFNP